MIPQPVLIALLLLHGAIALLTLAASPALIAVVAGWDPASAQRSQLRLESRVQTAFLLLGRARVLSLILVALWVVAVAQVLPGVIPGAMCGTGVLQAMSGNGGRVLAFAGMAAAILHFWGLAARMDRSVPVAPLTPAAARLGLMAAPIAVLAFLASMAAVGSMETARPVDCCAVVYDEVRNLADAIRPVGIPVQVWMLAAGVAGMILAGTAAYLRLGSPAPRSGAFLVMAVASLAFVPMAYVSLVDRLSAYHYGVLHHHCPWCLFLKTHNFAGWPMFGALAVIMLEGPAPWIAARLARVDRSLEPAAARRARLAAVATLISLLVFALLAALPPLVWRLRYGVWMH